MAITRALTAVLLVACVTGTVSSLNLAWLNIQKMLHKATLSYDGIRNTFVALNDSAFRASSSCSWFPERLSAFWGSEVSHRGNFICPNLVKLDGLKPVLMSPLMTAMGAVYRVDSRLVHSLDTCLAILPSYFCTPLILPIILCKLLLSNNSCKI